MTDIRVLAQDDTGIAVEIEGRAYRIRHKPKRLRKVQINAWLRPDSLAAIDAAVKASRAPNRSVWIEEILMRSLSSKRTAARPVAEKESSELELLDED